MILEKSTRGIVQKGAIGNHKFNLSPRSLFVTDVSMIRCAYKSKLLRLLEMLRKEAGLEQGRQHQKRPDACTKVQWMKTQRTFYGLRAGTRREGSQYRWHGHITQNAVHRPRNSG